jgi:ribosomal protein L30E
LEKKTVKPKKREKNVRKEKGKIIIIKKNTKKMKKKHMAWGMIRYFPHIF